MRRLKTVAINAALVVGSLALFIALCDLVVFRFVLKASDVPANVFADGLVRYAPNQAGIWRVRNEIAAPYAINAQGWNSGVGDYHVARTPGVRRVAVIGDSYVEAMQVAHDRSLAERAAAELAPDRPAEVFRFGISGAPLSQYVHMAEREVSRYAPDWIVVVLVHNDFDESLSPAAGRYTSSFLRVRVNNGAVEEVAPEPWRPGAREWLRRTATARFLYYRWQVRPELLRNWLVPAARAETPYSANVDVAAVLAQMPDVVAVTDHLFGRLAAVARAAGARLLLVMDGDRQAIYAGRDSAALALNAMAAAAARKHAIPFLDLHPVFAADWQRIFPTITGTSTATPSRAAPWRRRSGQSRRSRRGNSCGCPYCARAPTRGAPTGSPTRCARSTARPAPRTRARRARS
jgi:GDSL-like Lipase/Acylhydrolase family